MGPPGGAAARTIPKLPHAATPLPCRGVRPGTQMQVPCQPSADGTRDGAAGRGVRETGTRRPRRGEAGRSAGADPWLAARPSGDGCRDCAWSRGCCVTAECSDMSALIRQRLRAISPRPCPKTTGRRRAGGTGGTGPSLQPARRTRRGRPALHAGGADVGSAGNTLAERMTAVPHAAYGTFCNARRRSAPPSILAKSLINNGLSENLKMARFVHIEKGMNSGAASAGGKAPAAENRPIGLSAPRS